MKFNHFLIGGGILVVIIGIILCFLLYTSPENPHWRLINEYPTSRYNIEHLDISFSGQGQGLDVINESSSLAVTLFQSNPVIWEIKEISNPGVMELTATQFESFYKKNILNRLGCSCATLSGAPVKTIWTFSPVSAGTSNITLECRARSNNQLLETLVITTKVGDRTKY